MLRRKSMVFPSESQVECLLKSESESRSVLPDSLRPQGHSPWNSPGQNTAVGRLFLLQEDLPNPGTEARSPALLILYLIADFLPAEPPGKPRVSIKTHFSLDKGRSQRPGSLLASGREVWSSNNEGHPSPPQTHGYRTPSAVSSAELSECVPGYNLANVT